MPRIVVEVPKVVWRELKRVDPDFERGLRDVALSAVMREAQARLESARTRDQSNLPRVQ